MPPDVLHRLIIRRRCDRRFMVQVPLRCAEIVQILAGVEGQGRRLGAVSAALGHLMAVECCCGVCAVYLCRVLLSVFECRRLHEKYQSCQIAARFSRLPLPFLEVTGNSSRMSEMSHF